MAFLDKFASRLGVLDYKGTWDAENNIPDLTTPGSKKGHYYIVSTPGVSNIDGTSTWENGDWVVNNGIVWQKIDAADKAKTSQLETSLNSLSNVVNGLVSNVNGLANLNNILDAFENADENLNGAIADLASDLRNSKLSDVFYVSNNGDDVSGTGSQANPFSTITAALLHIESLSLDQDIDVVVFVGPGAYTENVTITRPRTHIVGLVQSRSNAVTLMGNLAIIPSTVVGGIYNSTFTIENLLIAPSSGDAITIAGLNECNVFITNVYCYADGPSIQRGIVANQTSSIKTRIQIQNVLVNNVTASSRALYLSNTYTTAQSFTCYVGATSAVELIGTTLVASNSWIQANHTSSLITVNYASVLSLGNSYIYNQQSGGSGINISAGCQTISVNNTFQISGTSGFAVSGVTGSIFAHANNCFVYGTSNKISTSIGAGSMPMLTSFTSA